MKNFVQQGGTVTLTAPYAVASGAGALVGSTFGVATGDVANGASGEFVTSGVFDLLVLGTDTIDMGQKIYWDNTNKRCTETAAANYLIGAALEAKLNGPTTVRVRLDGIAVTVTP